MGGRGMRRARPDAGMPLRLPGDAVGMTVENEGYGVIQLRTSRAVSHCFLHITIYLSFWRIMKHSARHTACLR